MQCTTIRRVTSPLVWAMLLAAFIGTGCSQLGPAQRATLDEANRLYQDGKLQQAEDRLDPLITRYSQAQEIAEAYYLRGLCRARAGEQVKAAADFEQAIARSRYNQLTARAKASLAALSYRSAYWHRAVELYMEALPELPDRPPKDEILYAAGIALRRVGRWDDAARQFAEILLRYRDRPIAREAIKQARWRHAYYSIQLGAFRDADHAAEAVHNWRSRNVDAVQENMPRQGEALWIVRAGHYRSYIEAVDGLKRIRRIEPGAYIIP